MVRERCVYLLLCREGRGRGRCGAVVVGGVAGKGERYSGWLPESVTWNPMRGKGQPKINLYRVGRTGLLHMQHQLRRQRPFFFF